MTAAWVVPVVTDVSSAFSSIFIDQDSGDAADPTSNISTWLPLVVARVRGAISQGGRIPISLTSGSVPPEAKQHVIALTAEACICNTPRLVQFVELQPLKSMLDDARKFIDACRSGLNVTTPSDPDTANLPFGCVWGDTNGVGTSTSVIEDMKIDTLTP